MGEYTSNGFCEYRYVRIPEFHDLGAVAFKFDVDYDKGLIGFSWAVCSGEDNFSKKFAREITSKRLAEKTNYISAKYDKELSLVDNAIAIAEGVLPSYEDNPKMKAEINRMLGTFYNIEATNGMIDIFSEGGLDCCDP